MNTLEDSEIKMGINSKNESSRNNKNVLSFMKGNEETASKAPVIRNKFDFLSTKKNMTAIKIKEMNKKK